MRLIIASIIILLTANMAFAQNTVPTAETIITAAYKRAAAEKKNIIVLFHASWCGWCRKMDASMNDDKTKKLFDDNYVTVHLTVEESKDKKNLENPGADLMKKKYHGEEAGLPFWLIFDKNGKLLGDSYIRKQGIPMDQPGESIGCPASDEEVAAFITILRSSSSLTEQQLTVIAERFKKNKAATSTAH